MISISTISRGIFRMPEGSSSSIWGSLGWGQSWCSPDLSHIILNLICNEEHCTGRLTTVCWRSRRIGPCYRMFYTTSYSPNLFKLNMTGGQMAYRGHGTSSCSAPKTKKEEYGESSCPSKLLLVDSLMVHWLPFVPKLNKHWHKQIFHSQTDRQTDRQAGRQKMNLSFSVLKYAP